MTRVTQAGDPLPLTGAGVVDLGLSTVRTWSCGTTNQSARRARLLRERLAVAALLEVLLAARGQPVEPAVRTDVAQILAASSSCSSARRDAMNADTNAEAAPLASPEADASKNAATAAPSMIGIAHDLLTLPSTLR
jgi:hypothetical protein